MTPPFETGTIRRCRLPQTIREALYRHARQAFPEECCGLILGNKKQGAASEDILEVQDLIPSRNLAEDPRRHFEIDPRLQFDLLRHPDGRAGELIGCYHSHPMSAPEPSPTDRRAVTVNGFLWLIHGTTDQGPAVRAYLAVREPNAQEGAFISLDIVD